MKYILTILFVLSAHASNAQKHTLEKLWETDSIVAVPESALMDVSKNILYVSLIDGGGWEADGKGGIARLKPNGMDYDSTWVTGLNAPKGLGIYGNNLFAANINNVTVINIKNAKVEKKITIDSAFELNDLTVDNKGIIYVSDSRTGKIWKIENDKPELFLSNMNGLNGLKWANNELYIGAGKSFLKATKQKQIIKIAEMPEGIDGIEPIGNGDFILSAWKGYIFYVSAGGNIETLADMHLEKQAADIGYDAVNRIVFVPTLKAKTVIAYRLN